MDLLSAFDKKISDRINDFDNRKLMKKKVIYFFVNELEVAGEEGEDKHSVTI